MTPINLYIWAMNITGILGGSLNLFTIYLIIWVSPKTMKNYRYFILFYQISSCLFELILHFATIEPYFPALSARLYGVLYEIFHIHATIIFEIGFFFALNMILATAQCFLYRHRLVLPKEHWLRLRFNTWSSFLAVHYFVILFIGSISIFRLPLEHPPNAQGLKKLLEDYPTYSFLGTDPDAWIADLNQPLFPPYLNFSSVFVFEALIIVVSSELVVLAFFFIGHSVYLLESPLIHMSAKTKKLHKKLSYSLFAQIMVPLFSVAGPLVFYVFVVLTGKIFEQSLLNGTVAFVSSHATLSSILICAFTEPYRIYILNGIKRVLKKSSLGRIQIVSHLNSKILFGHQTHGGPHLSGPV